MTKDNLRQRVEQAYDNNLTMYKRRLDGMQEVIGMLRERADALAEPTALTRGWSRDYDLVQGLTNDATCLRSDLRTISELAYLLDGDGERE